MIFVRAGDVVVHCDVRGPAGAPVVVMAHSLGADLEVWQPQAEALAHRFRVVRYDLRGHGLTDGSAATDEPRGYTIDLLARDALALLDALHIERAHFCGLSLGGMIAQRLAATATERVASLVLCSTATRIGPPSVWDERIALIRSQGMGAVVDAVLARWFSPQTHADRPEIVRGIGNVLLRTPVDEYVACAAAVRDADLRMDVGAIHCPTLIVVGDRDPATPPAAAAELRDGIAGAELATVENAAHIVSLERPSEVNRLLLRFLDRGDASGDDAFSRGMRLRTAILGAEHVRSATERDDPFTRDFQRLITTYAWGEVWDRAGLDRRTRSMLTIAMLATLGRTDELRVHVRAARNAGASVDDVREVLLQVAIYAGVPAANSAFRHAADALQAADDEGAR